MLVLSVGAMGCTQAAEQEGGHASHALLPPEGVYRRKAAVRLRNVSL